MAKTTKEIYTKAKEILIGVWTGDDYETAPTEAISLTSVIADSLSITQDEPDTTDIDCETSDDPIYTVANAGSYQITLNNASMDDEFLVTALGWIKDTETGTVYAPSKYESRYVALQVQFEGNKYITVPKMLVAPQLSFESLSTNVAYGTLSGTATSAKIGSMPAEAPICKSKTAFLTASTTSGQGS
jgi:hypothetical protein